MACPRVAPSHWVGVGTLVFALLLTLAGVASPCWRLVNGVHVTVYQGLWQHCTSQAGEETRCHFNQENSGLWRAIQVTKLLSLLLLTWALVMSFIYISGRARSGRRCPASSVAAWLGGLTSLLADLLYVGFTERHAHHTPPEIWYAWSFALAVGGSIMALFAALILCLSARYCAPRFASYLAKPYLSYRHYSVDVDQHGRPQYYLYPGHYLWSGGKDGMPVLTTAPPLHPPGVTASDKRREFEKTRHAHVWFASQGGAYPSGFGHLGVPLRKEPIPPPSPFPDYPGGREFRSQNGEPKAKRFHGEVAVQSGFVSSDSSGVGVSVSDRQTLDTSDEARSPQPAHRPAKKHGDTKGKGHGDGRDSSILVDSGHVSPADTSRTHSEGQDQPSSTVVAHNRGDRHKTHHDKEVQAPFTINTSAKDSRKPDPHSVMYEIDLNEPSTPPRGERLVWQRPSHLPYPSARLSLQGKRLWLPWTRKPNQNRLVIKTRKGRFVLGSM